MNEPQSIAAEKIALSIIAGVDACDCPMVAPSLLMPLSLGDATTWPPASSTTILDSFTVPKGQALLWTYISLYTCLADESTPDVNYGFNFTALAQLQYRSGAAATSNFVNVTGQVQSQALFNKPVLFVFDSNTRPQIVLYPNGSTQTADSLRVCAEATGYLIPSSAASIYRVHASTVS